MDDDKRSNFESSHSSDAQISNRDEMNQLTEMLFAELNLKLQYLTMHNKSDESILLKVRTSLLGSITGGKESKVKRCHCCPAFCRRQK